MKTPSKSKKSAAPWVAFAGGISAVVVLALGYRYLRSTESSQLSQNESSSSSSQSSAPGAEQSLPMTRAELSSPAREALVDCLGSGYLSVTNIDEAFQMLKRQPGGFQERKTEWETLYFAAEDGSQRRVRFESNDTELHLDQIDVDGNPVPIDLPEAERSVAPAELLERYRARFKVKKLERNASAEVTFGPGSRAVISWHEVDDNASELKFEAVDRVLHCDANPDQPLLQLCECEKKGEAKETNDSTAQ